MLFFFLGLCNGHGVVEKEREERRFAKINGASCVILMSHRNN